VPIIVIMRHPSLIPVLVLLGSVAHAAPVATSVAVDNGGRLWVGSQYGALVSDDAGRTWHLLCEAPLGSPATAYQVTRDCKPLAATANGLFHSSDGGCDWARAGGSIGDNVIGAIATDPTNGANVLAAVNVAGGISRVHISFDGGLTFAPTDAFAPAGTVFTQLSYATDGQHAYALAIDDYNVHVFSSLDGGRYWTLQNSYYRGPEALLIGPSPTDPNVIYYSVFMEGTDLPVRSADGGVTYSLLRPDIALIYAGAFASDGTLYLATDTGIRKSIDGTNFLPQPIQNQVIVHCLTIVGNTLYGCADEATAGFSVGTSTDDGMTWTPLLRIHDNVVGPLVCGSSTQVCSECYSGWPAFATQLGLSNPQQPACADGAPLACPPPQDPPGPTFTVGQPGTNQAPPPPATNTPSPQNPRACAFVAGGLAEPSVTIGLLLLLFGLGRARKSRH